MENIKKRLKDRRLSLVVVLLGVLIASSLFLLPAPEEPEEKEDQAIKGGVIGGPVQIGGSRVQVVDENRSEVEIEIHNSSLQPETVNIQSETTVYLRNLHDNDVTVNFIGFRKMASLEYNQSYEITFNKPGSYSYAVSGGEFSREGTVVVE